MKAPRGIAWISITSNIAACAALLASVSAHGAPARGPERDGLCLRLALGATSLGMQREGSVGFGGPQYYTGDSSIEGGAGIAEITIGGSISRGVMVGGTLLMHSMGDPVLEQGSLRTDLEGALTFAILGPTIDWTPDPRGGFHLGATAGIAGAWVRSPPPRFTEHLGGAGGAVSLHLGYAWWIADEWSVGLLGRATGARLRGEHASFGITGVEEDDVTALSLLFSATFH